VWMGVKYAGVTRSIPNVMVETGAIETFVTFAVGVPARMDGGHPQAFTTSR